MMPLADGMEQLVPNPVLDKMVFMLCKDANTILPTFYRLIDSMMLEDQRWSDFFAQLTADRVERVVDGRISIRTVASLNSVLENRSDLRGLIVPLAAGLAQLAPARRVPAAKHWPTRADDSMAVRACASIIDIMAGSSITSIGDRVGSLLEEHPRYVTRFAEAIVGRELSYDDEVRELMVLGHLAGLNPKVIWHQVHRNFSRRRSRLFIEGTWSELSLPSRLRRILDN
jgi:hypothetical protein